MSERQGWGFYGRKKELGDLRRWMSSPTFSTISVIGGRGVGKTELIMEATRSLSSPKPFIYVELPEIHESDDEPKELRKMTDVNDALAVQARSAGLADSLPPPPDLSGYVHEMVHFRNSLGSLLRQGAVVALDEFQNSRRLLLESGIKALIDALNRERNMAGGKVVVAGSHQQKMLTMLFSPTEPMYDRVDLAVRLFPLTAPEVLEMAAARGWLSRPNRFLTAYTAFGGHPRSWRRFHEEIDKGMLPEPEDGSDTEWRQRFAIREIMRCNDNPSEKFLESAFADFSEAARGIAVELAKNPRGVRWSQIVERRGGASKKAAEAAEKGFKLLRLHLGVAEFVRESELIPGSVRKVRLTDQAALFELNMEKTWNNPSLDELEEDKDRLLDRLSEMEGPALERLTAEWLRCFKLFARVEQSTEMRRPDGVRLEIDVIGGPRRETAGEDQIALCSCKRNSDRHRIKKTHEDFDYYLRLQEQRGLKRDAVRIRRFLVSPQWNQNEFRNDGFKRLDFASMAKNLDFAIKPWPRTPSFEPERPRRPLVKPEDNDRDLGPENLLGGGGPDFDM